jgi:hypothetical protein
MDVLDDLVALELEAIRLGVDKDLDLVAAWTRKAELEARRETEVRCLVRYRVEVVYLSACGIRGHILLFLYI